MSDTATICTKCGTDLSGSKRFMDSKGRSFCEPCAAALRARAAAKLGTNVAQPPAQAAPDDGIIPLADAPEPARPASRSRAVADGSQLASCPDCGHPMTAERAICTACGFNRDTGRHMGNADIDATDNADRPAHRPKPCKKCGYDMTGTKTGQCPECGTINIRMSRGRETEKQTLLRMFVGPLIMIGVGLAIAAIATFLKGFGGFGAGAAGGAGGITSTLVFLVIYAISVPIGFAVYVGCSIAFIGFDEPLGVTFVRLAGVYAVIDALSAILSFLPWWIGWPIQMFVYVGLLMQVMELDLEDAWVVAVVTYIVNVALFIVLFMLYQAYF